jgi:O-antigen ligase
MDMLIWAVAGSVIIQTIVAVAQVLEQNSIGLQALGELELNPSWSGISIVWSEGFRSLRAYGLSDHPNILGGILAFSLIMIIGYYVASISSKKVILVGVFISGVLALFLTFSRPAWIGFIAGLLVMVVLFFRDRKIEALQNGFFLLLASVVLVVPFVWHNAPYFGLGENSPNDSQDDPRSLSNAERQAINRAANEIFQDNALVGVGLGSLPIALKNEKPDFPYDYQPARIVLLNAAVETGIFGGLLYFLILVIPWLIMWINRERIQFSPGLISATGALAAATLVSFYDYYTWLLTPGRFWQWLVWGLWVACYTTSLNRVEND